MQESIDAPRVHVRILEDGTARVDHEDDPEISGAIEGLGLPSFTHGATSMFYGGVGAASRLGDGSLAAAGDPRREAATRVS
jgi:gamma-glutamyltranspeptidase/glutathione hydrolase